MSAPPVATVVVAYLSADHLDACLASTPAPTWVIDNSPHPLPHPPPHYEHHPANPGFAAAVNRGFALTTAPFVLVLNPDCVLLTTVDPMLAEFADPQVGAVGGRLVDAAGHTQAGFTVRRFPTPLSLAFEILGINRLFPANAVNRRYRCLDLDLHQRQAVDQPAGAFLLIRRTAWQAIGGFDERFQPVWFEDVDFCKRLKTANWTIRYIPEAIAQHAGGHSVGRMSSTSKTLAWYGSLLRYSGKHLPRAGRWLVALSLIGSVLPRGVLGLMREGTPAPLLAHIRVSRLAIKRLIFEDLGS
jgi:N-acetylglucosaminyl-diphospho-decaprenol L-rhamnosyltransferase